MNSNTEDLLSFIKINYPIFNTCYIAKELNISEATIRRMAKRHGIKKDPAYIKAVHESAIAANKKKYEEMYKTYNLTDIQRNIIVGSLLGDGSLALYGRSKNAYYREHGCVKQLGYRQWKQLNLTDLDFIISRKGKLSSPCHPLYTELYRLFYDKGIKRITPDIISMLNHPIGLACLYMDDGTLVIDSSYGKSTKYLFPRISLYTLSFSRFENEMLKEHLLKQFHIPFKLKERPDGNRFILELNQRNHILYFLELVKPYVSQISCMAYKVDLQNRMNEAKLNYLASGKVLHKNILLRYNEVKSNFYSEADEKIITKMKLMGNTDKEIAETLNRSYWSIVDKIRGMRTAEKLG